MIQWKDEKSLLDNMKFPEKLWNLVNNCTSGAISWSSAGDSITIEYCKFKSEFLSGEKAIFKTSNITSFIRQLNLYGFRKCHRLSDEGHEFRHQFFIKDRKDLLSFIIRKPGQLRIISPRSKNKIFKKKMYQKIPSSEMYINDNEMESLYEENKSIYQRKPLNYIQDPNGTNRRQILWNNFAATPYPHLSNNLNNWLPTSAAFYNFPKQEKENLDEASTNKSPVCNNSHLTDSFPNFLNPGNMYFLLVPGYGPPQQNPFMFQNQTFTNGIIPVPGVPFVFPSDTKVSNKRSESSVSQKNKENDSS